MSLTRAAADTSPVERAIRNALERRE